MSECESVTDVLGRLAGQGRVEVEPGADNGPMTVHLETPEGEIRFSKPVDGAKREGADFARYWRFGALSLEYSVDRTPGNRTYTVLVKDSSNED